MEKTELGFQAEIDLLEGETFNFCLKNEKDELRAKIFKSMLINLV